MALRHINPVNDNAVQLIADPLLSNAPWLEINETATDNKAEPAPAPAQALAEAVEQARMDLLHLLLEKPALHHLLHERLVHHAVEGVDYTMINNDKGDSTKPVQDSTLVQGDLPEMNNIAASNYDHSLDNVHYFPVFLLKVAELGGQWLKDNGDEDTMFRKRLYNQRLHLQKTRQSMISSNTGLVAFVACKYKTQALAFEDLMQEGTIGLIKAVDRFDPSRGIRFSTYAIFWIKQAISRLIVKQEKVVRLPIALAERASVIFEIMRNCYLEHNRWPTLLELKAKCDMSMDDIKTISRYYQATHSLDTSESDDDDSYTLMSSLPQTQFAQPLDDLIQNNLNLYLDQIVDSLTEKEATILNMRFGLRNHHEMTLQAIADQLHVTRERVRQIQNDALKKLKQQFGCDLLPFLEVNPG